MSTQQPKKYKCAVAYHDGRYGDRAFIEVSSPRKRGKTLKVYKPFFKHFTQVVNYVIKVAELKHSMDLYRGVCYLTKEQLQTVQAAYKAQERTVVSEFNKRNTEEQQ